MATRIGLDPFHFFNRHVLFLLPSFIVLIGVSFLSPRADPPHRADRVRGLASSLIVATLLFGPEVKGSRRWITLLGVNIQASESAKPAFVVMAAWLFAESTQAAGNAGDLDGAGAAADAGVAAGDGTGFRPDHADPDGVGRAVLHRGHADDLGGRACRRRRRRTVRRLSAGAARRGPHQALHESGLRRHLPGRHRDGSVLERRLVRARARARASPSAACRTATPTSCSRWRPRNSASSCAWRCWRCSPSS